MNNLTDIIDQASGQLADWRSEARQMIPMLRAVAITLTDSGRPHSAAELEHAADRLVLLLDAADERDTPPHPRHGGKSSAYTVAPRAIRNPKGSR